MGLSPRLEVRQSQSLTLTPQLMQSIRLLQLSHLELAAFVDAELLRNPLLEREDGAEPAEAPEPTPEVTAYDANGAGHDVPLAQFLREPDRLLLPATVSGMPVLRERQGIEIDYVAGFGTEPEDVPADIRQALLLLVGYWFEHRDAVIVAGSGAVVPSGFDRMVAGYKRVRL